MGHATSSVRERGRPLMHHPRVLTANEVHVWRVRLDRASWRTCLASGLLADDEVARAQRFQFEADQRRFVVCRANLRMILSGYLDCRPSAVRLRVGLHGKPFLDPGTHGQRLRFNVSHSHEVALVGVTAAGEVGVDIEHVRRLEDVESIVEWYFSLLERRAFARAAPGDRLRTFFRHWTFKEAYLKASGVGLSGPLAAVDPALGRAPASAWTVRRLSPGAGYVAALAVAGRHHRIRQWNWPVDVGIGAA
jgi:4'-phosphopantetheinyl transferase